MKFFTYIALFLCVVLASGCEINDYVEPKELPDFTHEGRQTFGVKINNTLWTPFQKYKTNPNFKPAPVVWGRLQQQTLRIAVTNQETLESISLMVNGVKGVGQYKFMMYFPKNAVEFSPYASLFQRCKEGNCQQYVICQNCDNQVSITHIDTTQHVVSGTFRVSFQRKDNPTDILTLSDGRFDIKH